MFGILPDSADPQLRCFLAFVRRLFFSDVMQQALMSDLTCSCDKLTRLQALVFSVACEMIHLSQLWAGLSEC